MLLRISYCNHDSVWEKKLVFHQNFQTSFSYTIEIINNEIIFINLFGFISISLYIPNIH